MKTNTIIHGDCLTVMRDMPDACIKIAVTSPPYNIGVNRGKLRMGNEPKSPPLLKNGYQGYDDARTEDEYVMWQRDIIMEIMRILSNDGALFYNHKWIQTGGKFLDRHSIIKDFPVRCIVIWDRACSPIMNTVTFAPSYEVIYVIANPDFRLLRKGINSVWRFGYARNNDHPAPFPVELPLRCIDACIARNDKDAIVLDPFMGSGSTAVAADRHGIQWVGIEQSEEYVRMARGRMDQEQQQAKLAI